MAMPPRNNRKEDSSPPESRTQPPPSLKHNPHIPFPSSSPSSSSSAADNFSCDCWTKPIVFPPGYKFVPTDEDLILHYLKPFLRSNKNPSPNVPIHRVNIYESNPERLSKEYDKGNDKEWFFITERTMVREGGKKRNRSDNGGFWKATTALQKIETGKRVAGYKTALEYYIRKKPNAVKSDWLMYEYLIESSTQDKSNGESKRVDHALCKIYMTPRGIKRKAEEEENEKRKKKEEGVEASKEEVEQPFPFNELYELINSHQIPENGDYFLTGFIDPYQLDIDRESSNNCCLKKSSEKE